MSLSLVMANDATKEEIAVIFHAARIGRTDVLKNAISMIRSTCSDEDTIALISQGRSEDGATPLHLAALAGNSDVIRFLLNANANLNIVPNIGTIFLGKKPYDVAVDSAKLVFHVYMFEQIAMGRVESINRLLKGGVPVTIRDGFELNDTALHWASSFNSIEVARLLLASGIDVDAVNSEEQTPLHIACKGRSPKDLVPSQSDEIEKLLSSPPEPSMTLRNTYLKSKLPTIEEKKLLDSFPDEISASLSEISQTLGRRQSSNGGNTNSDIVQSFRDQSVDSKRNSIWQGTNHDDADDTDLEEFGLIEKSTSYNNKDIPLLVLWPPTRKQIPLGQQQSLMLSSLETVLIYVACDSVDIFPILKHSGLIDVLERFHLSSQVKRASKESVQGDPKIRFCVDNNLCPGRHSFEIIITSENISILASDSTGGLYGLYALIQLLQLHSKLKMYPDGAMALLISPIILRDSPDIMNRGILWSFRRKVRTSFQIMKENIQLFSEVRINMLFLVIDSTTVDDAKFQQINNDQEEYKYQGGEKEGEEEGKGDECRNEHENFIENEVISSNIKAFDEICENVCVELIPTVILSSVYQRLSLSLLKSFSHTMVCLIFTYDLQSVRSELEIERKRVSGTDDLMIDNIVSDRDCEIKCKESFREILNAIVITGFSSVTFSCSKWVSRTVNPTILANSIGLNAIQRTMDQLCPQSLYSKPIYFAQEFVKTLWKSSQQVVDQGLSLSIFPAFMDSDFIFPPIILKYYCFLHAGLVWNRDAVGDMLRFADPEPILKSDIPTDLSILKEVVTLLIMSDRIPKHQIGIYGAILNVFIGEVFFNQLDFSPKPIIDSNPNTPRGMGPNGGQIENLNIDDNKPNSGNLVNTEKHLWALLISPNSVQDSICPSRSDAIYLLRHYRRILNNSKWKATPTVQGGILMAFAFGSKKEEDETPFGIELDTFFSTIQILSVLCKAIILARNSTEKMMKNGDHDQISFGCLMNSLTPGIKSDIANSLLAALEHTSMLSKKRFQVVQLCNSLPPFHQLISANTSCKDQYEKTVIYTKESSDNGTVNIPNDPMPTARSGYLRQIGPVLPALAVMKTISDLLPIPKSLEETLLSIFS